MTNPTLSSWESGDAIVRCSFCGKSQNDASRLVASNTSASAICNGCVMRCVEVLIIGHEPDEPTFAVTPAGQALAAQLAGEARA